MGNYLRKCCRSRTNKDSVKEPDRFCAICESDQVHLILDQIQPISFYCEWLRLKASSPPRAGEEIWCADCGFGIERRDEYQTFQRYFDQINC